MKEKLRERILKEASAKRLPCKKAFAIAAELSCPLTDVGRHCDELGIKICGCQLGCF